MNFKLYRIRCWTVANVGISGLEIYYKDRITSKEVKTIDAKRKEFRDEEEHEFTFEANEMIQKATLWKIEALIGFEITTNKGREQKFGRCGEGTKIELDELDGSNYICGFFCGFHKKDGIISLGFYYINKKGFYLLLYFGIINSNISSFLLSVTLHFNSPLFGHLFILTFFCFSCSCIIEKIICTFEK